MAWFWAFLQQSSNTDCDLVIRFDIILTSFGMVSIGDQIKIATSNPWANREAYSQQNFGSKNSNAKVDSQEIRDLLAFFKLSELVDFSKPIESYQAVKDFVDEKIQETLAGKVKVGAKKQAIEKQLSKKLSTKYYGPLDGNKKYQSKRGILSSLAVYLKPSSQNKDNVNIQEFHHGEFRNGLASGLGIRLRDDGVIIIAEFSKGLVKKNILRLYPEAGITFNDKAKLTKKQREQLSKQTQESGRLSKTDSNLAQKQSLIIAPNQLAFNGTLDLKFNRIEGKLVDFLGRVFEGKFINNKPGKGSLINSHNIREQGNFSEQNSFLDGPGNKAYPDGTKSEGNWEHGVANGHFKITKPNGTTLHIALSPDTQINAQHQIKITNDKNNYEFNGLVNLETKHMDKPSQIYLDDLFAQGALYPVGQSVITKSGMDDCCLEVNFYPSSKINTCFIKYNGLDVAINKPARLTKSRIDLANLNIIEAFSVKFHQIETRTLQLNPIDTELQKDFTWVNEIVNNREASETFEDESHTLKLMALKVMQFIPKLISNQTHLKKGLVQKADEGAERAVYYDPKYKHLSEDPNAIIIYEKPKENLMMYAQGRLNRKGKPHGSNVIVISILNGNLEEINYGSYRKGQMEGVNCKTLRLGENIGLNVGKFRQGQLVSGELFKPDGYYAKYSKSVERSRNNGRYFVSNGIFQDGKNSYSNGQNKSREYNTRGELLGKFQFYQHSRTHGIDCLIYENANTEKPKAVEQFLVFPTANVFLKKLYNPSDRNTLIANSKISLHNTQCSFNGRVFKDHRIEAQESNSELITVHEFIERVLRFDGEGSFKFANGATVSGKISKNRLDDAEAKLMVFDENGNEINIIADYTNGMLQSVKSKDQDITLVQAEAIIKQNINWERISVTELFNDLGEHMKTNAAYLKELLVQQGLATMEQLSGTQGEAILQKYITKYKNSKEGTKE